MNREDTEIPREFILKQIENEISAGFAFVEAARRSLRQHQENGASHTSANAAYARQHIATEMEDSAVAQVRNVIHQLAELREAVEGIRLNHFKQAVGQG